MSTESSSDVNTELPKYMQRKSLSIADTWNAYRVKIRSGDMGSLPAVIGLIILVILFSSLNPVFFTPLNFANFFTQAAVVVILAMGLIFVLLLGEIDLSAGVTSGVSGALLAVGLTRWGLTWPIAVAVSLLATDQVGINVADCGSRIPPRRCGHWYFHWFAGRQGGYSIFRGHPGTVLGLPRIDPRDHW